jgi:hypothetical protein
MKDLGKLGSRPSTRIHKETAANNNLMDLRFKLQLTNIFKVKGCME